jgi:Mlc titration factor MtfA (ptsG expression regulator)
MGCMQTHELEAARLGESALDPYGGSSPQELFPVAVETFFERPTLLRRKHDRLYSFLRAYFGQDPASWEERMRS